MGVSTRTGRLSSRGSRMRRNRDDPAKWPLGRNFYQELYGVKCSISFTQPRMVGRWAQAMHSTARAFETEVWMAAACVDGCPTFVFSGALVAVDAMGGVYCAHVYLVWMSVCSCDRHKYHATLLAPLSACVR